MSSPQASDPSPGSSTSPAVSSSSSLPTGSTGTPSKPTMTRALSALNPFALIRRTTLSRSRRKEFYQHSWDNINPDQARARSDSLASREELAKENKEQGASLLELGPCSDSDPDAAPESPKDKNGARTPKFKKNTIQRRRSMRRTRASSVPAVTHTLKRKFSIK